MTHLSCAQSSLHAVESPYRLGWKQELAYGGTGVVTLGLGAYFRSRVTLFTPETFEQLDRTHIPEGDRIAVLNTSVQAGDLSDYFLNVSQVAPLLFLIPTDSRQHFGQIAAMYGETVLINGGLTTLIKYTVRRPRPYVYNPDTPTQSIQTANAQASFISGHASATAAATFFAARVFSDLYPESSLKPIVWTAAVITPAITGYLRVRAGKHYPTDVIGGYVLGAAIGYLVPYLHRSDSRLTQNLSLVAGPGNLSLGFTF